MRTQKPGPHPKPTSELKSHRIVIHLSEAEHYKIKAIVRSETPRKIAAYIRSVSLDKIVPTVPGCNIELWRELAPVLSNLNQIAKKLNSGETLHTVEALKFDLQTLRNRLLGETR